MKKSTTIITTEVLQDVYFKTSTFGTQQSQCEPCVGFEPTTLRLTAGCSTAELSRIILCLKVYTFKTEYSKHYIIKSLLGQALDLLVLVS